MPMALPISERGRWTLYTVFVLFGLLAFQSIWLVGTTTLRDFERLETEIQKIQDEKSRIKAAAGASADASQAARSLIEPLEKKLEGLAPQITSAVNSIKIWNPIWRWLVFWAAPSIPTPDTNGEDAGAKERGELRSATGATQVLGLYILPLFYGWLGALLLVVQKLRDDPTPDAYRRLQPSSRVVTGMVAGPMIGMFLSPEFLSSLAFQATPFLLAFIGGYSTDVFFAVIDRFLTGFRGALQKTPGPEAQGGAGGAPAASQGNP